MSVDRRITALERELCREGLEAVRIVVYRTPPGVEDEAILNAYVRTNPDAVDRVLEYRRPGDVVQVWGEPRCRGLDDD